MTIEINIIEDAFFKFAKAKKIYEILNREESRIDHINSTARGHEAVQIALGTQLLPQDYLFPYYRDDAILLGLGISPYDLFMQWLAKNNDIFSAGRTYYSHPSLKSIDFPKIPHQSAATGMQAIPATGVAMGLAYKEKMNMDEKNNPIVVCSMGDSSVTEGEVSEAFQMASLKQLPILYLVQDNGLGITAKFEEISSQNAYEYCRGFIGLQAISIDGSDFVNSYKTIKEVIKVIRKERRPFLIHAKVELLGDHTSKVKKEYYRKNINYEKDPYEKIVKLIDQKRKEEIENQANQIVEDDFQRALKEKDPDPKDLTKNIFAPTLIVEEKGNRVPSSSAEKTLMVDCALHAIKEIMKKHPECLFYGQDVGDAMGGVFREAATLLDLFGKERIWSTAIQEAFIIGSTVGMSAVGLKPIVEVQFADYIWPGLNQLSTEVSKSCYLTNGKWPVSMILRVPTGAYDGGGPFHSASIESVLVNIKGIKIAYPSNGADLKGLMKAAYYDPNPVVILEHKGLYWSKLKGTESARVIEPDEDYVLPLGKAKIVQEIEESDKESITIVTYGMGVHWALGASSEMRDKVEIIDLRTLCPIDYDCIFSSVRKTNKCMVLTEEPKENSFALSLAGSIQEECFEHLDGPILVIGSENVPAVPMSRILEKEMLPSIEKVNKKIIELLKY